MSTFWRLNAADALWRNVEIVEIFVGQLSWAVALVDVLLGRLTLGLLKLFSVVCRSGIWSVVGRIISKAVGLSIWLGLVWCLGQRTSGLRNHWRWARSQIWGQQTFVLRTQDVELEASGVGRLFSRWDSSGSLWNNRFLCTGVRCSLYHTPHYIYPSLFKSVFVHLLALTQVFLGVNSLLGRLT